MALPLLASQRVLMSRRLWEGAGISPPIGLSPLELSRCLWTCRFPCWLRTEVEACLPSCFHSILIIFCCVLGLCHSFRSCAASWGWFLPLDSRLFVLDRGRHHPAQARGPRAEDSSLWGGRACAARLEGAPGGSGQAGARVHRQAGAQVHRPGRRPGPQARPARQRPGP